MDYDKLAKELGGSAYSQPDLDKLAADLGGEIFKPSYGQQLISGEGPDIKRPSVDQPSIGSVLEGTTLSPEEQAAPATGPSLATAIEQAKAQPKAEKGILDTAKEYASDQADLLIGDAKIGILNTRMAAKQLKMANLMELQEAAFATYGDDLKGMPQKEREEFLKTRKVLENDLAEIAELSTKVQEVKKKYGERASTKAYMELPKNEDYKNAGMVGKLAMIGDKLAADPYGIITDLGLTSMPQSLAVAATAMAARVGMLNPKVVAAFGGNTSAMMEFGNIYADLREQGMGHKEAWEKAGVKSGIIGAFDAVSFNSAGNAAGNIVRNLKSGALKETAKEVGKETGKQAALGAAGEGLGSYAINQPIEPTEVVSEAIGEIFGAPGEAVSTYRTKALEKTLANQPPSTLTDVIVPTDIDPELHARASMKLEQLISQAEEVGKVNVREVNKLARELDIEPSKKVEDTTSAIYARLYPEAPAAEAAPAEEPVVEPAKEKTKRPSMRELFNQFKQEYDQKIEALRPKKAPELTEEPVVETPPVATPEQAPIEQPEFKAPEPVVTPQVDELGQVETSPLEEARVQLDVLKNMAAQQGYVSDARLTDRINQMEAVVQELERREAAPQATEVVKEEAPVEAPKTQAQINQERQAAKREAAAAAKPSKEEVAEKKMLDAIEDIKKDKGTANQFIAKYGKPMFDRANAEGYIQNEANDQRLFSTLKLDELWSKYNKPEEYAAMMKRREAGEKERQAEQAKIAEEAKPAYTPPKLRTDNPGGEWLKNKRQQSINDGTENGIPVRFGSTTGIFKEGKDIRKPLIPVDVLARLQGMNNEQQKVRQSSLEAIKKIMDETDHLPDDSQGDEHVPFINVYQDGTPYVNEGNHRIMAAKALGFKYLPVEISYFNGAEQIKDGILSPESVITYDMQAKDDGFSRENYRGKKKPKDMGTEAYPFAKPEVKVSENKVFTDDAAEKARALLKSKLNQLNSGIDPEVLQAGIILSGYHVEKGARTFAAYSAAMIKDLGNAVKPYLKSWYMALKYDPRSTEFKDEMDSADVVDKFEFEKTSEFPDLLTPEGKFEVAQRVSDALLSGAQYDNIAAARQFIKGIIGRTVNPGTAEAKEADEAIEVGVVMAARSIVDERNSPQETYDKLVDLYNRQPSLNVRTSESVSQQAYSTPAPLAYIASQFAGIDNKTTVYEPTAGNGMLLIGANPKNVTANELNPTRFEMLKRVEDGAELTNDNAMEVTGPKNVDAVIANPPFGSVGETFKISDAYSTKQIDHAISLEALDSLKDNGRAVLIVGSVMGTSEDARQDGYRGKDKREFYYNLYKDYNVVDHFTVSGDLYGKQGAKFPVDVIVINGKGKAERDLPAADLPKVYSSYEQLKEKLDEASRMESKSISPTRADVGVGGTRVDNVRGLAGSTVRQGVEPSVTREESRTGKPESMPTSGAAETRGSEPSGVQRGKEESRPSNIPERGDTGKESLAKRGEGERQGAGKPEQKGEPERLGGPSVATGTRVATKLEDKRGQEAETENQVPYNPSSNANSVGALVPVNMRDAIEKALKDLENKVGDIDEYVAKSLDMDVDDVLENFSAEQVDALGLAIDNAAKGSGFIIGDQTGIGKGRVVAGMIKFALANGKIPIFVTEKPNLYADMIRDLDDIGMTKELGLDTEKPRILITNTKEKIDYQLYRADKNGDIQEIDMTIKSLPGDVEKVESVMKTMMDKNSLGDYKVVFTNYTQVQTQKGNLPLRAKFIEQFGKDNYVIFDESHNAGGTGTKSEEMSRSKFIRQLVHNAFGTFFSSATYAKRADVMDLYASTDMKYAVDDLSELGDAIKYGGVPMQQIVATMLTKAGQYIRRERTFKGVSYDTQETKVDKETAENMAKAMREILEFSRAKNRLVKGMQKEFDKEAKIVKESGGTEKTRIQSANFGSTMHNLIDQMLLSLKSKDTIDFAISRLKNDEKVVITVSNTMGSFIKDFAADLDIKSGEELNITFADLYVRYLDKQRDVTITGPEGKVKRRLTDEELGPNLVAEFKRIKNSIENSGFGSAPISPIDYMHNELRKAGYKTDEITGRIMYLDYSGGTSILKPRRSDMPQRLTAIRGFNSGKIDVLILNQAGSTGISLHSNAKFEDKRKRHMIIAQAEKNIDTHMQMLGRVHRTGQVVTPSYSQMMADIPAEMRPAAVLMKKMASLNANTTASRKSAVTAEGVVDFMNEYGGQVVMEYARDNPEVIEEMGLDEIITIPEDSTEAKEEDIRKFTGYIPVLPIKQQEEVYSDLIDRYNELIERENAMGTNKLEAKALDLDAETLSAQPVTEDKGIASIFAEPAVMEKVDVKRTVKPFSSAEVKEQVTKSLDGKDKNEIAKEHLVSLRERMRDFAEKQLTKARETDADDVKIQGIKDKLNLDFGKIKSVLETYKIGDEISIKDVNGIYNYAVITDITNPKKTVNPSAGSDWKMNLAMANGDAKALTISFSQINTTYTLAQEYYVDYLNPETGVGEKTKIMDIFDKGATVRREKRWMVTGNILAGFAKYPGQIVTYTKNDGTIGQGVLMSRQFDFEKAQKEAPVRIRSAGQAMRFFEEVGGVIGTDDNNFRIEKRGTRYEFTAAKSKRQGGKYFTNDDLIKNTGVFYSVSGAMKANTYSQQQAEEAISYLIDQMGEKLFVKTGIEKARAMFAPPKLENIEEKQLSEMAIADRKETIKEFAKSRRSRQRLVKQIAKYGSDIAMQRQLNEMLAHEENLKNYIDSTKIPNMSAEAFMAAATDALRDGNITPEVERFIRSVYEQYPNILNGIKLSVRAKEGNGRATGNFDPIERLVTLWKGTSGVRTSKTARHELVHTMEQMMTPEAKKAVITAWARNLESGMKKYKDRDSKKFFDAVLAFLENPTEETAKAATNIMPDYSYYQYLNPSEYWAVNAEKLFGQQLGGAWTRFVKAMEKLFEGLKAMFFMNNKLAIHRAFDQIIKKQPERNSRKALADYLDGAKVPTRFLNQIEEDSNLVDELDIPEVKDHTKQSFKEYAVESFRQLVASAREAKVDPKDTMQNMLADGLDKTLRQRNLHVWSAAGLADRDAKRWDGKIRTANGELIPSVAVSNNLRSAYIANAVMVRGGLEFNGKYGQFGAVEREHSVGNIIKIQAELRNRLTKSVADKLINGYTAARRSRGIQNDYFNLTKQVRDLQDRYIAETDPAKAQEIALELQDAQLDLKNNKIAYEKIPSYLCVINEKKPTKKVGDKIVPNIEFDQDGLPKLDDSKIDALIARDKAHPELKALMENFTAVNHNLLDNLAFSGRLSKPYVEKLKKRKDYSPWNRVMDEEGDDFFSDKKPKVNVSGVAHFKEGRTERDIDNVVESMIHNVYLMTRSAIKNYAQKRIIIEYGERRPSKIDPQTGKEVLGRLRVFPTTGSDEKGVRVPAYIGGRRMIFNIPDHLVADAYIGMSVAPWEYPGKKILTAAAQLSRRTITFSLAFQARQVFYDAWQAALVSGTQNPWRVVGKSLISFFKAVDIGKPNQTVQILGGFGIGGFRSHHREARKELEIEIGMMSGSNWQTLMSTIDNIGDASDLSQRVAVSEITMKETNDPALALYKASEVMDFGKHGLSTTSQIFRNTVTFMQAWATQLDTLAQSVIGGGVKGKARKELQKQFASTFAQFTILAIAYTLLALKDPDYDELDDLEKARNIYVPFSKKVVGHHVLIPLHNSASYFFKVIPELLVNSAKKYGTEKEIDLTRAGKVLLDSFTDSILGPTPIATGIKPSLEIFLDKDFHTGGSVVPKSVAKLDPEEQYVASTSELAKALGRGLGISPAKTDHFIRGTFGTAGALGQWFSNMIFSEHRVAPQLRETPGIGFLFGKDVNTLNEQLFYDLKERSDKKYDTWTRLIKDDREADADKYYAKNQMLIEMNGYISSADEKLKYINTQIREIGRSEEKGVTSAEKRQEINDLNRQKQELLENIFLARKEAGL